MNSKFSLALEIDIRGHNAIFFPALKLPGIGRLLFPKRTAELSSGSLKGRKTDSQPSSLQI